MSRNVIIGLVVIIVVALAGWFLLSPKQTPTQPSTTSTPAPTQSTATEGAMMKEENKVNITADGFSPKEIAIKAGEGVTWTNSDSVVHAVNSAPHPIHTAYSPLNLGNITPGGKVSLIFPTAGTYKYHDHLNPTLFGSITVQ